MVTQTDALPSGLLAVSAGLGGVSMPFAMVLAFRNIASELTVQNRVAPENKAIATQTFANPVECECFAKTT